MSKELNPKADNATEVTEPLWGQILVCVVFGLLGAAAGWLVKLLVGWLVSLPWAPMQGPARLLDSIPEPGLTIGLITVGGLVGLVGGVLIKFSELSVSVSDSRVVLTRSGESQEYARGAVAMAFRDGKQLVLLGHRTEELARENCDQDRRRLADAFTAHGYDWADQDPYQKEFQLWVPETSKLPSQANALLKARGELLKKPGTAEERNALREELTKLDVVVRDKDKRQYWRPLGR
ncbi:YqeB family protein [Streptomyces sclerotialus]|uniref:YqeB family protein n=1 Tax=Streptomyces sclerotialus TaxID=1957 RepID=UPI00068FE74C